MLISLSFLLTPSLNATTINFKEKTDLEILKLVTESALSQTFVGLAVAHNIGGQKVLVRVSQGHVNGIVQKKREILDSGIVYVHNQSEIREYFPNEKVVKIYNNAAPVFPNFLLNDVKDILKFYSLKRYGPAQTKIANKNTFAFELNSKDELRWGVRFWLDSDSGLLLKLHYLDQYSNILKKEFFAEISINPVTKPDLHFSLLDSKKWRKISISSFTDEKAGLVYNKVLKNGFAFVKCLDSKVFDPSQNHDSSFVRRQCLFSDGVALVSAVTQKQVQPIRIFQRSKGCMSQKVGLKGNKPMYVGGCVPRETIKYFFNKLSVE